MDIESLKVQREEIEKQFNEQSSIKENATQEQLRLQGEYRLISNQISELEMLSKEDESNPNEATE